jgi:hypothetical protein
MGSFGIIPEPVYHLSGLCKGKGWDIDRMIAGEIPAPEDQGRYEKLSHSAKKLIIFIYRKQQY